MGHLITMKQLGLSVAAAALLVLSVGCEAEGAEQDYNTVGGSGGGGGGDGDGGGGSCPAPLMCLESPMVGAGTYCVDPMGMSLPPACDAMMACPSVPGATCMMFGTLTGCVKPCP